MHDNKQVNKKYFKDYYKIDTQIHPIYFFKY